MIYYLTDAVELLANDTYRVYCTSTCQSRRQVSGIWSLVCLISELIVKGRIRKEFHRIPWTIKKKCTLVQALRRYTGRTAHRGSRGIALPFHDQRH